MSFFPFFFPISLIYLGFLQERKIEEKERSDECFLSVSHTKTTKRINNSSTKFSFKKETGKRSEATNVFFLLHVLLKEKDLT